MNRTVCIVVLIGVLAICHGAFGSAQPAIVEFLFDTRQEWQAKSHSLVPAASVGTAAGVSARPGDYALDLSANEKMGDDVFQGHAFVYSGAKLLDRLQSFTLCGWFKASEVPLNYARLFNAGAVSVWFHGRDPESTQLVFDIDGVRVGVAEPIFRRSGEWIFFAISYDGTATAGNVSFYAGTSDSGVSLVNRLTLNKGTLPAFPAANRLALGARAAGGNRGSGDFAFKGLIDNFRIFGSTTSAAGALPLEDLERIRAADASGGVHP